MKRNLSNPFRVLLSGVLDFLFYLIVLFILFFLIDQRKWRYHFNDRVYPLVNLLAIAFTISYILFLLPIFDYQGGSLGKRALGLKCLGEKTTESSFGNFLRKYSVVGAPILLTFVFSFRILGMKEKDAVVSIRLMQALIILIFLVQAVSLFVGRRSLFEKVSGTMVVPKNYQLQSELFSFEEEENDKYYELNQTTNGK